MRYIPLTAHDEKEMLAAIGAKSIAELFDQVPREVRTPGLSPIPPPISEKALLAHLEDLSDKKPRDLVSFAGAGIYDHFIPSVIAPLATRGEFATSYTPYQPEMA